MLDLGGYEVSVNSGEFCQDYCCGFHMDFVPLESRGGFHVMEEDLELTQKGRADVVAFYHAPDGMAAYGSPSDSHSFFGCHVEALGEGDELRISNVRYEHSTTADNPQGGFSVITNELRHRSVVIGQVQGNGDVVFNVGRWGGDGCDVVVTFHRTRSVA